MGWRPPEGVAGGRERDDHDAGAIVLVCRDGAAIAGCLRVVPPEPGRLLPTERDFGVRVRPPGSAGDVGRLVVAPGHRGATGPLVLAGLFAAAWLELRALGLSRAIGAAPAPMIAVYRMMGLTVTELGPPMPHWGEERIPLEVSGAEASLGFAEPAGGGDALAADRSFTRRRLLVGGAGAAGALLVVGVPDLAAQGRPATVGGGPTDLRTIGMIGRVDQAGRALTAVGRLTRVRGLPIAALSTAAPSTIATDPAAADLGTARFTFIARATIVGLSVLGSSISAVADGTIAIHFLPRGGARIDDPASVAQGRPLATLAGRFQNDLALDSPDNATALLAADLTQRGARAFTVSGRRHRLGRAGLAWTLRASGRGRRLEPSEPRSQIFLSGDLGVADARDTA